MSSDIFKTVQFRVPPRSRFNLSHEVKLTTEMGRLTPIFCQEVLPNDSFTVNTDMLIRLAPMLAPVMHRVNVYTYFFYVPNRLVWNNWESFITKGVDGEQSPVMPYFNVTRMTKGTLFDYFGIPPINQVSPVKVCSLPFRAYTLIWNEYFRDQNLQDPVSVPLSDGLETTSDHTTIRNKAWEKDYFTSALPWIQRGPDVSLPLGGTAPVVLNPGDFSPRFVTNSGTLPSGTASFDGSNGTINSNQTGNLSLRFDPRGTLSAQLNNATGSTINEFRNALALQGWFERNAVAGSRYKEQLYAHFGVISPDARLQRPEFLGGGKSPVVISEVLQTSASESNSPQANMAGHGISAGSTHAFKKHFTEHGYIIGLMAVVPRTGYQQGVPKMFQRFDNMDFAFPSFANLGEQPIMNNELYISGDSTDNDIFGYTPRYADYKYCPSRVAGEFRDSLSFWHLGRIFDRRPGLNASFVTSSPSTRIFAVTGEVDHLYCQIYNNIYVNRCLPKYGTPSLLR